MKKLISLILACAIIALPLIAVAENQYGIIVKLLPGKSSNYRDMPSLDGEKMNALKPGESLPFANFIETDERGVDWYMVDSPEGAAWISSRYTFLSDGETDELSYDPELADTQLALTEDATPTASPYKSVGDTIIPADSVVTASGFYVTEDTNSWYLVSYDGSTGWLSAAILTEPAEEPEEEPAAVEEAAESTETEEPADETEAAE